MSDLGEHLAKAYIDDLKLEIKKEEIEFLDHPAVWLKNHCTPEKLFGSNASEGWLSQIEHKWLPGGAECPSNVKASLELLDHSAIDKGLLYVLLVSGLLEESGKFEKEDDRKRRNKRLDCEITCRLKGDICRFVDDHSGLPCHPVWIVDALVTEDYLVQVEDPLRVALKLRAVIMRHFDRNSYIVGTIGEKQLRRLPRGFAEDLLYECVSPMETEILMDLRDRTVLFDIKAGKCKDIVQSPIYKKMYREEIFWMGPVNDSFMWSILAFIKRFFMLIFWNVAYPFTETYRLIAGQRCSPEVSLLGHWQFFSPISCFIADMTNYVIMVMLIAVCMLQGRPNQESTVELARQFLQGNISLNHSRLRPGSEAGTIEIELEKQTMSLKSWTLFFCLLSRIFIEVYQLSNTLIWTPVSTRCHGVSFFKRFGKKLCLYFGSDLNKIDLFLMGFLTVAYGVEFHYSFSPSVYQSLCVNETGCGENFDNTLEARRVTYRTNFLSVALLLSLIRLFHCAFLFVPLIGPILRSMQKMAEDVFKVLAILIFFSVGFFVPLFAMIQCYLDVYDTNNTISQITSPQKSESSEEGEAFEAMKTPEFGLVTMILSIMEGKLTYSEDIYQSQDKSTSIFFTFIMIFYFMIFGLLCFNLLIALISKRYDRMMESRNRDWRYSQFALLVDYMNIAHDLDKPGGVKCNDGMPFLFPFCLLYVPCRLIARSVRQQCKRKGGDHASGNTNKEGIEMKQATDNLLGDDSSRQVDSETVVDISATSKNLRREVIARVLSRKRQRVKDSSIMKIRD